MCFLEKDYKVIMRWTGILENQEKSGLSISKWCAGNHIGVSTLFHYKKIIKDFMKECEVTSYSELSSLAMRGYQNNSMKFSQTSNDNSFYSVDLTACSPRAGCSSKETGVRLLKKGFVIEVDPYFDEETLARVMAVINDA